LVFELAEQIMTLPDLVSLPGSYCSVLSSLHGLTQYADDMSRAA